MMTELEQAILDVLSTKAARGKKGAVGYMTAYQILVMLPPQVQEALYAKYGREVGSKAGHNFSAATYVAQVARKLDDVEVVYLDPSGLTFPSALGPVEAGNEGGVCGLFRVA